MIPTVPLSAYAQWKLEDDERFYATFPQARFPPTTLHDAQYVQLQVHHQVPLSKDSVLSPALDYAYATTHYANDSANTPTYQYPHTDRLVRPPILVQSQSASVHPAPQPDSLARLYSEPIMDHLPSQSPTTGPEPSSSHLPISVMPCLHRPVSNSTNSPTSTPTPQQERYANPPADSWADHRTFAHCHTHQPPPLHTSHPSQHSHPHSSEDSPLHYHPDSPHCHELFEPTGTLVNPYPRPSSLPLSPLPAGAKKAVLRKPPLACHFCRGRKIACGAPDPSNPDRTCNQCERRSLKCEYPLESRRGMRKKKPLPPLRGSSPHRRSTSLDDSMGASPSSSSSPSALSSPDSPLLDPSLSVDAKSLKTRLKAGRRPSRASTD